ncbi:MAG: M28 family peptidase [Planctomycetota bacterium]
MALLVLGGLFMMRMPGRSHRGPLPALTAQESALAQRLRAHVEQLAGVVGERNVRRPDRLEAAARYIEDVWRRLGYEPRRQNHEVAGSAVSNVEVSLRGGEEIVVVGAHYDSVPGCPAANDNASGVAAMLEIARLLRGRRSARAVRFVAFVNEEPPFFQTPDMGSLVYARRARERGEKIAGMLSLETIGCYSDADGSQRYPFPFSLFYPGTGDFIAFVGNLGSRSLVRRCIASFRSHTRFPSEGAAVPGWIPGVGWSDHWSFWKAGYPAVMITDTAPFRYAHYHAPSDTPDRLDYERMARVTAGVARVVTEIAGS